jgi:hypothetical protein
MQDQSMRAQSMRAQSMRVESMRWVRMHGRVLAWMVAILMSMHGLGISGIGAVNSRSSADDSIASDESSTVDYERDVRPIFKAMCFHCHGEEEALQGGLDMRLVRQMLEGGDSGPAIVAGFADQSVLWQRIESDEMPEGSKKLNESQKSIIRRWIDSGAATTQPEPDDPALARFTATELAFWAWQPIVRPAIPSVTEPTGARNVDGTNDVADDRAPSTSFAEGNPIDAFVIEKLLDHGVGLSPIADRATLIRRATFDLLGLPPTPQEVERFVADPNPQAFERLIDQLLQSPHYGERWGRHWLDLAGYAESDGNMGRDRIRPTAFQYRDYVIKSFNDDKPYDRFIHEQLAGDEMVSWPIDRNDPSEVECVTATGFLRMAPDATETSESIVDRNQAVAEVVKVVGTSILGISVGCAQCHDHRYDPITAEDYYRLRAIFDPALDIHAWQKPSARVVDVTGDQQKLEAERIELQAVAKEADIDARKQTLAEQIFEREIDRIPEAVRTAAREAVAVSEAEQTESQKELLKEYPNVKPIPFIKGFIVEYDKAANEKFEEEIKQVAKLRATKPLEDLRMIPNEPTDHVVSSKVLYRGDPTQPRKEVAPGEPYILTRFRGEPSIPMDDPDRPTTGRRLAYAKWLTDQAHPTVARTIVNRIWLHHFGKGIVNTPGDLGLFGDRPSHPELLDWLATEFIRRGWSIKQMHRLLMTSRTYQQQSRRRSELESVDPDNRLLGHMPVRRMEAEVIRDTMLAVCGDLRRDLYGPSVPVTEDEQTGKVVVGIRELSEFGKPWGPMEQVGSAGRRRSIYIQVYRSMPLSMLDTFDMPVMIPNCDLRKCSNVPPQSLLFLNDMSVVDHADRLTERLWEQQPNNEERINYLFALLFAAPPNDAEQAACEGFMKEQSDYHRTHGDEDWIKHVQQWPHAAEMRAMAALCQALMASNRFLYID